MALPTLPDGTLKPLEVDVHPDEMTVGDVRLSKGDIHFTKQNGDANVNILVQFAGFLIRHTNWTEQEVNALKVTELAEVGEMVRSRERAASVPLVSSATSAPGQEGNDPDSPAGQAT